MSTEHRLQQALQAHQRGDLAGAKELYERVLHAEPGNATAMGNLAVVAIAEQDYGLAEKYLRQVLSAGSDDAGVHSNLGVVLRAQGRLDDAIAAYQRALALRPDYPDAYHNLGNALTDQARFEAAIAAYRKAIELRPNYSEACNNLGNALSELKRFDEALASYNQALAAQPEFPDAHLNRGILFLRTGRLAEGWPDYEYRFLTQRYAAARPVSRFAAWRGEPLRDRNILVQTEQGLGDTIQFARFLTPLARQAAKVTFLTPPRLARLLEPLAKVVTMTSAWNSGEIDFETSLASLPYRLGTDLRTIPREVPYLFAEDDLVARWSARIGSHGFKVGICWQGNPKYADRDRSIPLDHFAALAAVPGVRLISLQKFHGLEQLSQLPAGMKVELLGEDFDAGPDAFVDTAAAMSALDLVVTSDTAVAHLAGALGRPVWLALKFAPHWTWLLDRSDSPWYPSMRLFRQRARGNWQSVFAEIAAGLRPRAGNSASTTASSDEPAATPAQVAGAAGSLVQEALRAHHGGELARARELYRRALSIEPRNTLALGNLAVVAIADRDYARAERYLREVLSTESQDPGIYCNLGVVLRAQARLDEAVAAYETALRLRPDYADAYHNLGNALTDQSRFDQAIAAYRKAIEFRPNYAEAYNNIGNALRGQGRLEEAIAAYRKAIELKPQDPDAYSNLGTTLKDLGRLDEAVAVHRHALQLKPANAAAQNNLGVALRAQGRFAAAVAAYRHAVMLKPDYPEAYNNLGNALQDHGRLEEAIAAYQRAIELKPDYPEAFGQLVHQRQHACDWRNFAEDQQRLLALVRRGESAIAPFILLGCAATPADQLLCAQKWAEGLKLKVPESARFRHAARRREGKIRLGYLSADFHQHATAFLIAEVFERHDRSRFEIAAYSYGPDDRSSMRRRLSATFDHFLDIRPLPHGEVARKIHDAGIDILVDLKGYTTHARTEIMAYRPAPIQVNYLGFPGTMGADFIDCIVADRFLVPEGEQQYYSEAVAYLPDCYQSNDTKREISSQVPSRAECGLPERGFVFCCFNNSYKITPAFFDIWTRLLEAVPGSVLWLLEANATAKDNLCREAKARGIDAERLVFAPRRPLAEHLARHRHADLFLDTLPCNAHTTASDALWAALPVLTCAGGTFAGRVAGSLLQACGLSALITTSLEEYEALALKLARGPDRLAKFKRTLEKERLRMPLFDIARFTQNLEAAYVRIWEEFCSRQSP